MTPIILLEFLFVESHLLFRSQCLGIPRSIFAGGRRIARSRLTGIPFVWLIAHMTILTVLEADRKRDV